MTTRMKRRISVITKTSLLVLTMTRMVLSEIYFLEVFIKKAVDWLSPILTIMTIMAG